jgi:hypothetical protein
MEELIKLKVKQDTLTVDKSKEVINAFIDSCCQLDPSIFEPFMHEDEVFEEQDKWRFLASLKDLLWSKELANETRIDVRLGKCSGCQCGSETHEFYSRKGDFQFAFLIETNKGLVSDIYQCYITSGKLNSF